MSINFVVGALLLIGLAARTTADPIPPELETISKLTLQQLAESVQHLLKENEDMKEQQARLLQENTDIKEQLDNIKQPQSMTAGSGALTAGSTYVRWGRTVCEGDAVSVYRGYAAGTHFSTTGGSASVLCLPESPEWGTFTAGGEASSYIWGVEYELDSSTGSPFSTRNNGDMSLMGQDAPCVVCHAVSRLTQIMIPAKKTCPSGWVMEYWGYLVGGRTATAGSYRQDYACLDEAPEPIPSGGTNADGHLWYPVQTACGALPCPLYVANRELTCVVCSK